MIADVKNVADDAERMPVVFLHIDPDMQWVMKVTFYQPEDMWINMLDATERTVASEREAVRGLRAFRTPTSIERLAALLNDPDMYVGVRVEAAHALAALAGKETDYQSVKALVAFLKDAHYHNGTLKPNRFTSENPAFMVSAAVVEALATVREDDGTSFVAAVPLLVDMLAHNDNATNTHSDYRYLHALLMAVGSLRSARPQDAMQIREQLERYAKLADLTPSYHSTIQLATLRCSCEALVTATSGSLGPTSMDLFWRAFERTDNCWTVRSVAAECALRVALQRMSRADALAVLNRLLDYVETPLTSAHRLLQIRVLELAAGVVRTKLRQMQLEEDVVGARLWNDPEAPSHTALVDRLWALVCGPTTAYDETLRIAATQLYQALWGLDTPAAAGPAARDPALVLAKASSDVISTATVKAAKPTAAMHWRDAITPGADAAAVMAPAAPLQPEPEHKKIKLEVPPQ